MRAHIVVGKNVCTLVSSQHCRYNWSSKNTLHQKNSRLSLQYFHKTKLQKSDPQQNEQLGLSKNSTTNEAMTSFKKHPNRYVATSLIADCVNQSKFDQALDVYRILIEAKQVPDAILYGTLINGFLTNGLLDLVTQLLNQMVTLFFI